MAYPTPKMADLVALSSDLYRRATAELGEEHPLTAMAAGICEGAEEWDDARLDLIGYVNSWELSPWRRRQRREREQQRAARRIERAKREAA